MNVDADELPEGWAFVTLDHVGDWATGGTPSRKVAEYFGGEIPWVKSGDLPDGWVEATEECISDAGLGNSAAKLLPAGTVSVALYGATIGKLGVLRIAAATNQACANCIVDERITSNWFLFYYLLSQRQLLIEAGQGGAQPNLTNQLVRNWYMPMPPLAEQRRIVAKVEALLARVNATRQRLAKAPAILKRFRQSALAAACSGRLTADWRRANSECEPAEKLLERVRIERFEVWSMAELAKVRAAGRVVRNESWKDRYEHERVSDAVGLPELPEAWQWTSFDSFAASFQYGPRFGEDEYTESGIPTVRTTDMDFRGRIIMNDPPRVKIAREQREHFLLQHDDLLVTRTGATIGKCALFDSGLGDAIASAYLIRYRLSRKTTSPRYLLTVLMSPSGQDRLVGGATAVAQPNINTTMIAQIPIPLPPLPEQHEIVRRVEALFKLADAIEKRVAAAMVRAEKLTQAILAKAFRGELVPTEAELARREARDYEPAAALLERIKLSTDCTDSTDLKAKKKSRGR